MTFNEEFARRFAEQLRAEDPDAQYRRSPTLSRRDLVAASYEAITAKLSAGYSFAGIAEQFAKHGVPIRVSTLRTYLQQHARKMRSARSAEARKNHGEKAKRGRPVPVRTAHENATPQPAQHSGAAVRADAAMHVPANALAEGRTAAVADPPADCRTASVTEPARNVPATAEDTLAATTAAQSAKTDATYADAPSTPSDGSPAPATAAECSSESAQLDAHAPAPTASPLSSAVATETAATGSGEKNASSPTRPDAPATALSRPEGLSRLIQGRASPPERRRNAFIPRRDQEL